MLPNDLYRKLKTNIWLQITTAFLLLLIFELVSILAYKISLHPGIPLPGSFLRLLLEGYYLEVLLAFLGVFIPLICGFLWFMGGEKRTIATSCFVAGIGIIIATWLALYIFFLWQGITATPYPWLAFALFQELPRGSVAYNHLVITFVGSYAVLAGLLLVPLFSAKSKAEKVFGKAHFATSFEAKKAELFEEKGLVLGKAYGKMLRLSGFESVLIVAPTGSGKTTSIAVPNLIEWHGSVIVNDLKGELHRLTSAYRQYKLGNKCFRWAPADESMNTMRYNPFFYVSENPNLRIKDLQLIAETLIPAERGNDGRFWYSSSREIFVMLALYLFETNGIPTLGEINDLSRKDKFFSWLESTIVEHKVSEEVYYQYANSLLIADKEKARPNILKDFHSRMTLFVDPIVRNATSGNDFDFRNIRKEKMSIYITVSESDMERLSPILTLFWAQFINAMASKEPDLKEEPHPVLALLDEFGNMARINKLQKGTTFMRGYRVRCLLIVQYLSQIISVYGRDDAKAFINSKVRLVHALNDADDAKLFANALGPKTVKVRSNSVNSGAGDQGGSTTSSTNFQSRLLMTPDELLKLPKKYEILFIEAAHPVKAKKTPWFKNAKYKKALEPYLEETKE